MSASTRLRHARVSAGVVALLALAPACGDTDLLREDKQKERDLRPGHDDAEREETN